MDDRINGKRSCIIIGPPCLEARSWAKLRLWWDYEIIATRALALTSLEKLWSSNWEPVTTAALGAAAASRGVFIAHPQPSILLNHPYVKKQISLGRVAVYVGKASPRYNLDQRAIDQLKRSLIAAATTLNLATLENHADIVAWLPGDGKA